MKMDGLDWNGGQLVGQEPQLRQELRGLLGSEPTQQSPVILTMSYSHFVLNALSDDGIETLIDALRHPHMNGIDCNLLCLWRGYRQHAPNRHCIPLSERPQLHPVWRNVAGAYSYTYATLSNARAL
jgi:hypothetical protein